jgi:triosephosphate isomerase
VIAPSFLSVPGLVDIFDNHGIKVAVQNVSADEMGAFTGEVAAIQVKEIGAEYAIIGHSERRQYFGETDEGVNKKVKKVLENDIIPVICIGETFDQQEAGETEDVLSGHIERALADVDIKKNKIILAYEPVWAIGTGKVPTKDDIEKSLQIIEGKLAIMYSDFGREDLVILYGGSVKPENIAEFVGDDLFDGALVGGASLDKEKFIKMVEIISK